MDREHGDKIKKDLLMIGIISSDSFAEFLCPQNPMAFKLAGNHSCGMRDKH